MESREQRWNQCVAFHGHSCVGLAIGFRAAEAAAEHIGQERAPDEEIVTVTENDACCVDAVQVLLGCTFGKGNLVHRDHGKLAFSFYRRSQEGGVRVITRSDAIPDDEGRRELLEKVKEGKASDEDRESLAASNRERVQAVLGLPLEELFVIKAATGPAPARAQIHRSVPCARCGEFTLETKLVGPPGRRLCGACAEPS